MWYRIRVIPFNLFTVSRGVRVEQSSLLLSSTSFSDSSLDTLASLASLESLLLVPEDGLLLLPLHLTSPSLLGQFKLWVYVHTALRKERNKERERDRERKRQGQTKRTDERKRREKINILILWRVYQMGHLVITMYYTYREKYNQLIYTIQTTDWCPVFSYTHYSQPH